MPTNEAGTPEPTTRALRLAAVQVLLAYPAEIPDDLEESLYAYRDQFAGQATRA